MTRQEFGALISVLIEWLQELSAIGGINRIEDEYIIEMNEQMSDIARGLQLEYKFQPPEDNVDINFIFSKEALEICFGLEQETRKFFLGIPAECESKFSRDHLIAANDELSKLIGEDHKKEQDNQLYCYKENNKTNSNFSPHR